jgi:hypothetical protein
VTVILVTFRLCHFLLEIMVHYEKLEGYGTRCELDQLTQTNQ